MDGKIIRFKEYDLGDDNNGNKANLQTIKEPKYITWSRFFTEYQIKVQSTNRKKTQSQVRRVMNQDILVKNTAIVRYFLWESWFPVAVIVTFIGSLASLSVM